MNTVVKQAEPGRGRRRHSAEFKREVIGACRQPGVSMAAVALANGLNANLLRRWVAAAEQEREDAASLLSRDDAVMDRDGAPAFVPLPAPQRVALADIRIELRRGATSIKVTWPGDAAIECAAWMRELLR